MEETQKKMADNAGKKPMDQAHKEFKRSLDQMQKQLEQAQKKRADQEAMQKQAANKAQQNKPANADPKKESPAMKQAKAAMQQMANAMANMNAEQMQQAMQQMAKQMESGQMSKEEMQQMQQAMPKLAQSLKDTQMNQSAEQLQQLAQMMQSMQNMDPNTLQQMAQMMRNIGQGMCKNPGGMGQGMLDAKALAALMQALKDGRMTLAMGSGMGFGGKMPGHGFGGSGIPSKAMKDVDNTTPRLIAQGLSEHSKGIGKSGSAQEFAKYLGKVSAPSKHLPNGKIAGTRSENGQELQINMTGDPGMASSSAPYYQAYQTSKKQAESTLNKENIPPVYKEQVRKYFDSIRP
jgi:hypothetical protein